MNGNRTFSTSLSKCLTDATNARLYEAAMGQLLPQGHFDIPCNHTLDDGLTTCGAPIPLAPQWAGVGARNPGRAFYQVCHLAAMFDLICGLHIGPSALETDFISTNGLILSAILTSFMINWPSVILLFLQTHLLDMCPGTPMPPQSPHHPLQNPLITVVRSALRVLWLHNHNLTPPDCSLMAPQKASLAMGLALDLDAWVLCAHIVRTLCLFGFRCVVIVSHAA